MKKGISILLILFVGTLAVAAEEALDLEGLEKESAPPPQHHAVSSSPSKLKLMGRVDLTNEFMPYNPNSPRENNKFENYHYFVFLAIKASEKVSFMGEIISKSFFNVNYELSPNSKIVFGKILVPFGDTRRFHHLYGGIQNYGARGVFFPNIWAENGVQFEKTLGAWTFDTYVVSGISGTSTSDPELTQPSNGKVQAVGARATTVAISGVTLIGSLYYNEWIPGKKLGLYGLNATTDYGMLRSFGLGRIRLGAGLATAWLQETSFGDIQKKGDYVELATNAISEWELRLRYGTYIDNSKVETVKDVHNFNAAVLTSLDVVRLMIEYQWNFEAVNEIQNDVLRAMASLDF